MAGSDAGLERPQASAVAGGRTIWNPERPVFMMVRVDVGRGAVLPTATGLLTMMPTDPDVRPSNAAT